MENAELARVLAEIADLQELSGGNAFKVRAYRRAAQVIDLHPASIAELWRRGVVRELPGIGAHLAEKIGELPPTSRTCASASGSRGGAGSRRRTC